LTFPDGVAERTLSITVVNDADIVADGGFRVVIVNPSTAAEIDPRASSITVSLVDDDFCTDCYIPIGVPACFIATAAYGSYLDPHVETLREFRDRYLLTNVPGRWFVAWYYRVSPAIAEEIAASPVLRAIVRVALTPVVYAIVHPAWAVATLLLIAGGVGWRRARWAARGVERAGSVALREVDDRQQLVAANVAPQVLGHERDRAVVAKVRARRDMWRDDHSGQ
jgi:hypothetical protein